MKVILKHFKCWEDKTFDLGSDGITLIKGKSGRGKSSILEAIAFALFGKIQKVQMYGKKSCLVTFLFNDVEITRTKGPNRLTLQKDDKMYEDDAAQHIIYSMFGNHYDGIGYMKQDMYKSFVLLSPSDKLAFIRNFVFT